MKYGILEHPKYGSIYKYETDGLNNNLIILREKFMLKIEKIFRLIWPVNNQGGEDNV